MSYDLVIINGDSFSEGNGLCRQFELQKENCKNYEFWLELKKHSNAEVFLDRSFSWGTKIAELLNIPVLNISKSGSSNKSILRRWYYLFNVGPTKNDEKIFEYKLGEEHWGFLNPNTKQFIKYDKMSFFQFKNPLCITQWSNSYRGEIGYRSLIQTVNPGISDFESLKNWIDEYEIPLNPEKFYTFFEYYNNLMNTEYLSHYENLNLLLAYKALMDSVNFNSYSIFHRMTNTMDFKYHKLVHNLLSEKETKIIESNTYTLKDVGVENLHYSLEGHEYFGETILNLIKNFNKIN
jgi:hypothetical protein